MIDESPSNTNGEKEGMIALVKNDSPNHFCLRCALTLTSWHTRLQIPHSTLNGNRKSRASDDTLLFQWRRVRVFYIKVIGISHDNTKGDEEGMIALVKNDSPNHFCPRCALTLTSWHTRLHIPHSTQCGKIIKGHPEWASLYYMA